MHSDLPQRFVLSIRLALPIEPRRNHSSRSRSQTRSVKTEVQVRQAHARSRWLTVERRKWLLEVLVQHATIRRLRLHGLLRNKYFYANRFLSKFASVTCLKKSQFCISIYVIKQSAKTKQKLIIIPADRGWSFFSFRQKSSHVNRETSLHFFWNRR